MAEIRGILKNRDATIILVPAETQAQASPIERRQSKRSAIEVPVESYEKLIAETDGLSPLEGEGVLKLLYGHNTDETELDPEYRTCGPYDLRAFRLVGETDELRPSTRTTRVGLVQHRLYQRTKARVNEQIKGNHFLIEIVLRLAGSKGVQIVCLQEAWTMPFASGTRKPWTEYAESAEKGHTTLFLKALAKQMNMVIVSPIIERDEEQLDTIWNTAVVIDNHGNYLGKTRSNYTQRDGKSYKLTSKSENELSHPVFDTEFGKIAVNLSHGHHHPLNWLMYKLNGAEIVFNPAAAIEGISETMWPVEARCAAIANSYFTCAINRVGTESPPAERSHFFGSTYVAAPDGRRTPGLSRTISGLLIVDCDLNLCQQASDKFGFQMTSRLPMYAERLADATRPGFKPQRIRATSSAGQSAADNLPPSLAARNGSPES